MEYAKGINVYNMILRLPTFDFCKNLPWGFFMLHYFLQNTVSVFVGFAELYNKVRAFIALMI